MEDGKAQLQTLILRSFKKGKKCYLTMLQGRRCILGKLTWWSARQLQGEVIFSAQAPHPWWCLSSEGWGAAEGHKWQNCGPSRHSLPPAALCHYGGIAATICDIHKVANSAEGCFLSILFSCQFPMRMRRKEKRDPEILRWYNLQLSTETPESWSLGLFSLVYLSLLSSCCSSGWTQVRHLSPSLCQQSRWEVLFQHFIPSGVTLGRKMGLLACFS